MFDLETLKAMLIEASRDPIQMAYGALGLVLAILVLRFVTGGKRRAAKREARAEAKAAKAEAKANAKAAKAEAKAAKAEAKAPAAERPAPVTPVRAVREAPKTPEQQQAEDDAAFAMPETPTAKAAARAARMLSEDGSAAPRAMAETAGTGEARAFAPAPAPAPAPTPAPVAEPAAARPAALPVRPDLMDLGVYTPHFDFSDSDAFRAAINEVREQQQKIAAEVGITIPSDEAEVESGGLTPLQRMAVRAFSNDCDAAIATVRWNSIEQMETRIGRAAEMIDNLLASEGTRINPAYAALKLKELRLTHEQREKQKAERDLRTELARVKKEEMALTRDVQLAERDEKVIANNLARAKQQAQQATGEDAFELEARVGELTRDLEEAHRKADRAREMVQTSSAGHLYVVSNVGAFGEGVFKIGVARRPDPDDHIREMGAEGLPFAFDTHATIYSDDAEALCRKIWDAFEDRRVNRMAEPNNGFFSVSLDEIIAELSRHVDGAEVTSDAEAQGYHQTLAQLRRSEAAYS